MPIKNKDGSVYTLRGPNPLLSEQADWDKSQVRLINMRGWKSEVVEDERSPVREMKRNVIDIGEELGLEENPKPKAIPAKDFIKEIVETPKPKPKAKPEPKPEPKSEVKEAEDGVVINANPRLARIIKERGVEFFCAPVIGQEDHVDEFYGTSYQTPIFGDQFEFDAVIVDQSDLQLQFWCVKPVGLNSIVYRKVEDGGERWWRIQEVEPKSGGWLVLAYTSDVNPDFS
jgi:hypothetical protein